VWPSGYTGIEISAWLTGKEKAAQEVRSGRMDNIQQLHSPLAQLQRKEALLYPRSAIKKLRLPLCVRPHDT